MRNVSPLLERWKGRAEYCPYALRKKTNLPVRDVERFTRFSALVEVWTGEVYIVSDSPEGAVYETSPYKMNGHNKRRLPGPKERMTG